MELNGLVVDRPIAASVWPAVRGPRGAKGNLTANRSDLAAPFSMQNEYLFCSANSNLSYSNFKLNSKKKVCVRFPHLFTLRLARKKKQAGNDLRFARGDEKKKKEEKFDGLT